MGRQGWKVYPSWEIFFEEKLTFKEEPTVVSEEVQKEVDWVDYMDAEVTSKLSRCTDNFVIFYIRRFCIVLYIYIIKKK